VLPGVLGQVARVPEQSDKDVFGGDVRVQHTAGDETWERNLAMSWMSDEGGAGWQKQCTKRARYMSVAQRYSRRNRFA
jgi:hypothetical protein